MKLATIGQPLIDYIREFQVQEGKKVIGQPERLAATARFVCIHVLEIVKSYLFGHIVDE